MCIKGEDVENVEHFSYLSIILDEHLFCKNHIYMLSINILNVISVMYKVKTFQLITYYFYYRMPLFFLFNSWIICMRMKADRLEILQKKTFVL